MTEQPEHEVDEPTIQPAMTRERWAERVVRLQVNPLDPTDALRAYSDGPGGDLEIDGWDIAPPERHALAALCLDGQSFGFTQEDVDDELEAARLIEGDIGHCISVDVPSARIIAIRHRARAAKIAALLPPKT